MMVSTKGRYALRAMVRLASLGPESYIPLRDLADQEDISEKYLEVIMKTLVKAGLVVGLRGKGGGYRLSRPAGEITAADVLRIMEGSLAPVICSVCPLTPPAVLRQDGACGPVLLHVDSSNATVTEALFGEKPPAAGGAMKKF